MTRCLSATRRGWSVLLSLALVMTVSSPAFAYLKFGFQLDGKEFTLRWSRSPVMYFVSDVDVPGVSVSQFQGAVAKAFMTWESVPSASIAYTFGGFTRGLPGENDGRTTLGFVNEPELDRVLASTSYLVDGDTGELLESDIFFNSAFAWSVAQAGERGRWDVESIALHEIGHLSGLGHSAIGETELVSGGGRRVLSIGSVMFPIALGSGDISERRLLPDDIAGISDLYPDDGFNDTTGTLSGRITKNGAGVFGAHIVAFGPRDGELVGNFSLGHDGQFSIAGLRPGPHVLRIEPIDDADTDSFFDDTEPPDVNFRTTVFERLVIVPRGGDSGAVQITVQPK